MARGNWGPWICLDFDGTDLDPVDYSLEARSALIESRFADLKNSGGRPGGTITAAWFLREFVGDYPWVHIDIAGTAYGDGKLPYQVKGSTGAPTRLFVEWVLGRVP